MHTHTHFPYMMKPSRSFPAACHQHHHHAARFTLARSFFFLIERQSWHVLLLLACYFWRKAYLKHTSYLSTTNLPTNRLGDGGGKGREGIITWKGTFSLRLRSLDVSLDKKTEWHGTSFWAGFSLFLSFLFFSFFSFFFLFLFLLHIQTCTSLPYIRISLPLPLPRERERDDCSRLDGRANGD